MIEAKVGVVLRAKGFYGLHNKRHCSNLCVPIAANSMFDQRHINKVVKGYMGYSRCKWASVVLPEEFM
jgi:hypothetical protein